MVAPINDDLANLAVLLHIDDYVSAQGRITIENVVQLLEVIFNVTPDRGRDLDMTSSVFKFHPLPPRTVEKEIDASADSERKPGSTQQRLITKP
jgi:hypothetical protein